MNRKFSFAVAVGFALVPLLFLFVIYNRLPQTVPVHFGLHLHPDRFGDKSELWLVTALLTLVSLGLYALFNNLHRIDPRLAKPVLPVLFRQLGLGLVLFMSLLNLLILLMVKGLAFAPNLMSPLIGLLFAFIGYVFTGIKPNHFAGFRLPWTLSNDENWYKTHRLGGRLWIVGGLAIAVICALLPLPLSFYVFLGFTGVMIVAPCVYSYRLFKNHQHPA